VGILSHRDLQALKSSISGSDERDRATITPAVVREPYKVDSLEPLDKVAAEMARRHIGSALVLHEGKLAGIFTSTDACRYLSELLTCLFRNENEIA
ncbi:MAG: CBS domain-containing protein, partial [Thermoanaerobaculia bacterium]|nr:CBS domain-containing protein [Thermoanaerobaculia bacterium]